MIKEFVTNKLKNKLGLYDLGEHLEILEEQKKSIEEKNKRNVQLLKDTYEGKINELNQNLELVVTTKDNAIKTIDNLKSDIKDMNEILDKTKKQYSKELELLNSQIESKIQCNKELHNMFLEEEDKKINDIKHDLTALYTKLMFMEHKNKFNYHICLKEIERIIERYK